MAHLLFFHVKAQQINENNVNQNINARLECKAKPTVNFQKQAHGNPRKARKNCRRQNTPIGFFIIGLHINVDIKMIVNME